MDEDLDRTAHSKAVNMNDGTRGLQGFYMFVRAVQLLTQRNDGIIVVGLAGPSGSGKTAFSEKVLSFIPGCVLLSMDNYNDASRLIDGNFDGEHLLQPGLTVRDPNPD